jgi:hypothetical protein
VIRVYDAAGNVIETHEHKGEFQRVVKFSFFFARAFIQSNIADSPDGKR